MWTTLGIKSVKTYQFCRYKKHYNMAEFNIAFKRTLTQEGGYSNDPDDLVVKPIKVFLGLRIQYGRAGLLSTNTKTSQVFL